MSNKIFMGVTIKTKDRNTLMNKATKIHNQLVGNEDYVNSDIVLNCDKGNELHLYIMDDCKDIPEIKI